MIEYATLDGVVLQDLSTNGNVLVEKIAGLTGLPAIRGTLYDRPGADGSVEPANQYIDARVSAWDIAVVGDTIALARANWTTIMRTMQAAVRQQKQLRWRANGDTLNLQADVRVAGMTPPVISPDACFYRFQVLLRAADPTNYDQTLQTGTTNAPSNVLSGMPFPVPWPVPWSLTPTGAGTVTLTNAGDAYAWPIIDITGPITNPVVQNQTTGQTLYFDGLTVNAGDTLHIDTRPGNRVATVNGTSQFASIRFSDSDFFPMSPGASEPISFSGSATDPVLTIMTVSMRSAYLS